MTAIYLVPALSLLDWIPAETHWEGLQRRELVPADALALGLEPLRDVPAIACTPAARTGRAAALPLGELAIETESEAPTNVVVRRFFYPFWQIDPALPLRATVPLRLVSFTAPAGRHD